MAADDLTEQRHKPGESGASWWQRDSSDVPVGSIYFLMRSIELFVVVALVIVGLASCGGDALTNRLEETYAIADFEIDGASRQRSEFNDGLPSTREGRTGISQIFTPTEAASIDEILTNSLAAAEQDGWLVSFEETTRTWYAYRSAPGDRNCDALGISEPITTGAVTVRLNEIPCPPGQP